MIARLVHYTELRRNHLPHSLAWAMSGLKFQINRLAFWISTALVIGCCLYLISEPANSAPEFNAKDQEIAELRKIVATCLGDKEGVLTIGDEIFFCKATSIGEKRR